MDLVGSEGENRKTYKFNSENTRINKKAVHILSNAARRRVEIVLKTKSTTPDPRSDGARLPKMISPIALLSRKNGTMWAALTSLGLQQVPVTGGLARGLVVQKIS